MNEEQWKWAKVLVTAISDSASESPVNIQYEDGLRTDLTARMARHGAVVLRQASRKSGKSGDRSNPNVDLTTVHWEHGALRVCLHRIYTDEEAEKSFAWRSHWKGREIVDFEFFNNAQDVFLRCELKTCSVFPADRDWGRSAESWLIDIGYLYDPADDPRADVFGFLIDAASYRFIQGDHRIRISEEVKKGKASGERPEHERALFPPWDDVVSANGRKVPWECLEPWGGLKTIVKLVRPTGLVFQDVYNQDEREEGPNGEEVLSRIPNELFVAGVIGRVD